MLKKKYHILLSVTALHLSALLFCVQSADSAPVTLNDHAMDKVTAGQASEGGGIIIGNSSAATFRQTDRLDLSGEAQQAARGLNIVNSAGSAVANTINIWDGSAMGAAGEGIDTNSAIEVNQVNQVTQKQVRSATISGYLRSEADQTESLNRSGSERVTKDIVNYNDTTRLFEETRISNTVSHTGVDTGVKINLGDNFYFEGNLGQGVAVAGHADVIFHGGSSDIAMVVGGGIEAKAGIGVEKGDLMVGPINFGDTEASAGVNISVGLSLVTRLELPKMEISIDGAGCATIMGSCYSESIFNEFTETRQDNSTLDIIENHQTGQNSYSDVKTSIYRSPFELESASAEYIVIDNSTLELDSDVVLELSDSVQREIKGMNIVNAIGSNVANSTNISRTARFEGNRSKMVLNQFNTVHHGR